MFERFDEQARQSIFFARFEASQFGSETIDLEHLVLGVMRSPIHLPSTIKETIRKQIEERFPAGLKMISTSADMPLSVQAQLAMAYAGEEAEAKPDKMVTGRELLLAVLRVKDSLAARILEEVRITSYLNQLEPATREVKPAEDGPPEMASPQTAFASTTLSRMGDQLEVILSTSEAYLREIDEAGGDRVLKRKPWTRREALGHLIDWAATYHQWCARVLVEPRLTAHSYPLEEWVSVQRYQEFHWGRLVRLWIGLNRLLIHVAAHIPEEKANVLCRVGIDPVQPFHALMTRYLDHHEDLLGQILARD
ncbi:MAG: Clp protease N-terminal domain-containing protein [Bryobacteraceae bacterium]